MGGIWNVFSCMCFVLVLFFCTDVVVKHFLTCVKKGAMQIQF